MRKLAISDNSGMTYHTRFFKVVIGENLFNTHCAFKKGDSCSPDCMFCSIEKSLEPGDKITVFCLRNKPRILIGRID